MILSAAELYRRLCVSFGEEIELTAGRGQGEIPVLRTVLVGNAASFDKVRMYDAAVLYTRPLSGSALTDAVELMSRRGAGTLLICRDLCHDDEAATLRRLCDNCSLPLLELGHYAFLPLLIHRMSEEIRCFYESERDFERLLECFFGLEGGIRPDHSLLRPDHSLLRPDHSLLGSCGFFEHSSYCAAVYLFVPRDGNADDPALITRAARHIEIGVTLLHSAFVSERDHEVFVILPDAGSDESVEAVQKGLEAIPDELRSIYDVFTGLSRCAGGIGSVSSLLQYAAKSALLQKSMSDEPRNACLTGDGLGRFIIWLSDRADAGPAVEDTIGKLEEYDRLNGTEYLHLLRVYLRTNCSLKKTAEELYVHKNSVSYALHRIESLLDRRLSDLNARAELLIILGLRDLL